MTSYRFVVEAAEAGARLDKLLAAKLPSFSRARLQALISEGHVLVSGKPGKAALRASPGAVLDVEIPAPRAVELIPEDLRLRVLFEDEALLVIDKPAGMVVHPGAGVYQGTVVHGLLHQVADLRGVGGELRPGIVHRIDKDTSGCLAVAKTDVSLRALQALFKARKVEKRYRALVHGRPPDAGEMDTLFGRHPVDRKRFSSKVHEGKNAVTRFTVLSRTPLAAWADVELFTGRTHQIRAHFADAGWPLFCDKLYGGTKKEGPSAPPEVRAAAAALGRQGLHAFRLAFDHPLGGKRVACESPLPPDLRAALVALGL
ncbi:MAG TPA: RluA family pseudouridine synthase [Myxococcales bacterium]|nr:RluA family pseudouridine synthase [Myxococcales bacterium]